MWFFVSMFVILLALFAAFTGEDSAMVWGLIVMANIYAVIGKLEHLEEMIKRNQ